MRKDIAEEIAKLILNLEPDVRIELALFILHVTMCEQKMKSIVGEDDIFEYKMSIRPGLIEVAKAEAKGEVH